MSDNKTNDAKMRDVIDIIEYVVDVRRRVYDAGSWSYIIWGGFCVITGAVYLLTHFWLIWFILFPVAGFIETSRSAGIRASLIGWGLALAVQFLGVATAFRYGSIALSAIGFGIAATVGFVIPFAISDKKARPASNLWLGKVIGTLWIVLVISTLVAISVTVTLADIRSIYLWMTMVGTAYMIMGVLLNDRGPVIGGALTLLSVIGFKVFDASPIVLTIVVGLISIGVGIYARSRD